MNASNGSKGIWRRVRRVRGLSPGSSRRIPTLHLGAVQRSRLRVQGVHRPHGRVRGRAHGIWRRAHAPAPQSALLCGLCGRDAGGSHQGCGWQGPRERRCAYGRCNSLALTASAAQPPWWARRMWMPPPWRWNVHAYQLHTLASRGSPTCTRISWTMHSSNTVPAGPNLVAARPRWPPQLEAASPGPTFRGS